jgi:hypothetical protein
MGIDLASFPLVVQYNKRDLPGVVPVDQLHTELNPWGVPEFETVASRGEGIMPTLREITRLVVKDLKSRQPHRAPPRPKAAEPVDHADADVHASIEAAASRATSPNLRAVVAAPPPGAPAAPSTASSRTGPLVGLSFSRLFGERGGRVAEVELLVRERSHGLAVRRAAQGVADVLGGLTLPEQGVAARAVLLGLDGRDYLRLMRLAAQPDGVATERDALFALHLLVSALFKAEGI